MTPKISKEEIMIDDIIHELEAYDFNSIGARAIVRRVIREALASQKEQLKKKVEKLLKEENNSLDSAHDRGDSLDWTIHARQVVLLEEVLKLFKK